MTRLVIANWKMNFTLKEAIEFCDSLTQYETHKLVIAAPNPYLAHLKYKFPHLAFAAQNVSKQQGYGPYTGEISAEMLFSCGINYALIGHPELRCNFGEDDETVVRKANNCIRAGITPIICLEKDLSIASNIKGNFMVALEPSGSIGTGVIPSTAELEEVFNAIKNQVAKSVNLIYGGSVNSSNLAIIKSVPAVDSVLLGGASLKINELVKILKDW